MKLFMTKKSVFGALTGASMLLGSGVGMAQVTTQAATIGRCDAFVAAPVVNAVKCSTLVAPLYAEIKDAWTNGAFISARAQQDCDGLMTKVDGAVAYLNTVPPKYFDAEKKAAAVVSKTTDLVNVGKLIREVSPATPGTGGDAILSAASALDTCLLGAK